MNFEFDIFAGGPPQKFAAEPYIDLLNTAFPGKKIFSPFDRPTQGDGSWFADNAYGLINSRTLFSMTPSFPFPGVTWEAGFFFANHQRDLTRPLEQLIYVVESDIFDKMPNGREVMLRSGVVVHNVSEGIEKLRAYFDSLKISKTYE